MKKALQVVCIAPDGETVRERPEFATIEAAEEHAANLGSKWIFYPIPVIVAGNTIRAVPHGMPKEWIGRKLATLLRAFSFDPDHALAYANGDAPFLIFP